ncbi:glycosyltransferase family 2 protein [candidate division KSB1 bacterium]|nr:glycosyltransferase family 2 protein [candidate division KSB1 bacterium]
MDVSIIIVNFSTQDLLNKLLISIKEKMKSVEYEIIVVDNNSEDDSVEFLKNYFPKTVLIENKTNVGFSKANNQGAKLAKGKYLLFLNSDTLVCDGVAEKMLEYLQRKKSTAIVGPKLLNQDDTLQRSCGIFPNLCTEFSGRTFLNRLFPTSKVFGAYRLGAWDYATEKKVDWVSAACMLIRKDVFDQIAGFDENIYMFYEDVDLCFRVKKAGYKITFLPNAQIYHLHGGSWTNQREIPIFNKGKSALYFFRKHYRRWKTQSLKIFILVEILLSYLLFFPYLILKGEQLSGIQSRAKGYNACLKHIVLGAN